MNRRSFLGTATLAAAAGPSLLLEGCSLSGAIGELEKWEPTVEAAFAGVIALVGPIGAGLSVAASTFQNTLWPKVTAALNTYLGSKTTSNMQNVIAALQAAGSGLASVATALGQGANGDVQTAEAALALLTATLDSILAQLGGTPTAPVATASARTAHTVRGVSMTITPATSGNDFKKKYNHLMQAGGHPERFLR